MRLTTSDGRFAKANFAKPSHLCFTVHMCPSPICDIRRPICDSDFFGLASQVNLHVCLQNIVYVHMYAAYDIRRPICDSEISF